MKKKFFLSVWELLIIGIILLIFVAIAGPKFGAFQRRSAAQRQPAASTAIPEADAGRGVVITTDGGPRG